MLVETTKINKQEMTVVSSLDIAETFEKNHAHVLRDIKELECSDEFRESNFGLSSYITEQNRKQPMYYVTRDGFTLLAMGYTGEKATIEAVVVDLSPQNIELALNGNAKYSSSETGSTDTGITTMSQIDEGDYVTNLALIANKIGSDDKVIVWFKKALCTSGLDLDMKNKSIAGNKYTFEAYAEQSDENVDTLPNEIIVMNKS